MFKVSKATWGQLAPQALKALSARQVRKASKVKLGLRVRRDQLALKAWPVPLARPAHRAFKGMLAPLARQAALEPLVQLAQLVPPAQPDLKALKAWLDRRDRKALPA